MRFFFPGAKDGAVAERLLEATKFQARRSYGFTPGERRIRRIRYRHERGEYQPTIGEHDRRLGEMVLCILEVPEHELFYVCSLNRGVARDSPMMVGASSVLDVEYFDDAPQSQPAPSAQTPEAGA